MLGRTLLLRERHFSNKRAPRSRSRAYLDNKASAVGYSLMWNLASNSSTIGRATSGRRPSTAALTLSSNQVARADIQTGSDVGRNQSAVCPIFRCFDRKKAGTNTSREHSMSSALRSFDPNDFRG